MHRRKFLITCGALSAAPLVSARAFAQTPAMSMEIPGAYMLWYNRPSMIETADGFVIAYTTSSGDICVTHATKNLQTKRTVVLHHFEGVSDHSAPSIVRIPKGKFAGHILVFFSNHASELYCIRSNGNTPESIDSWSSVQMLDSGRATYPSAYTLPNGTICLQYTLQYRSENTPSEQWRTTVHRSTSDGGSTWTEPVVLLDFGPNQFPYSTPVAVSNTGRVALCYSIYSSINKRNRGLWVLTSDDGFATVTKTISVLDIGTHSFVPYEIRWKDSKSLALSYSITKGHGTSGISAVAHIDTVKRRVHTYRVGPVAMHTYPGGAALLPPPETDSVIYSPPNGGLTKLSLVDKVKTRLVANGNFASPFLFQSSSGNFLVALKNPSIKSTRDFDASLLIKRL